MLVLLKPWGKGQPLLLKRSITVLSRVATAGGVCALKPYKLLSTGALSQRAHCELNQQQLQLCSSVGDELP